MALIVLVVSTLDVSVGGTTKPNSEMGALDLSFGAAKNKYS